MKFIHAHLTVINNEIVVQKISKDLKKWFLFEEKDQHISLHPLIWACTAKREIFNKNYQKRNTKIHLSETVANVYLNNKNEFCFNKIVLEAEKKEDSDISIESEEEKIDCFNDISILLEKIPVYQIFKCSPDLYFLSIEKKFKKNFEDIDLFIKKFPNLIPKILYPWWLDFEKINKNKINFQLLKESFIQNVNKIEFEILNALTFEPKLFLEFIMKFDKSSLVGNLFENNLLNYFKIKSEYLMAYYKIKVEDSLKLSLAHTKDETLWNELIESLRNKSIDMFWFQVAKIDEEISKTKLMNLSSISNIRVVQLDPHKNNGCELTEIKKRVDEVCSKASSLDTKLARLSKNS